MFRIIFSLLIALGAWGSSECLSCHPSIVQDYTHAAHAHAHDNPAYIGVLTATAKAKNVPIEALRTKCDMCHAPRDEKLSCESCHHVDRIEHQDTTKPAVGKNTLLWMKDQVMAGSIATGKSPYHGIVKRPFMNPKSDALCMSCHRNMNNTQGVSVCATGDEHVTSKMGQSCIECHMGKARIGKISTLSTRPHPIRAHRFDSPRNSDILKRALTLTLKATTKELHVHLHNRSSHKFPTGTGLRIAMVETTMYGRSKVLSTMVEPLEVVYGESSGKVTMPPLATQLLKDTRLLPDERRILSYPLPKGVDTITTRITYRLVKEPMLERLGLTNDPVFTKIYPVSTSTLRLRR